jgi:hypothetical protein
MNFKETVNNYFEEIVQSDEFKIKIDEISKNYANLKQELHIRNVLLEMFNEKFDDNIKAIAEYRNNGNRVDLAVVDKNCSKNRFFIELKYQFTNDDKQFSNYKRIIDSDYKSRKSDMFIVIISDWLKMDGDKFAEQWGISQKLSKYISKSDVWKNNIESTLDSFDNSFWSSYMFSVKQPYEMKYHFYVLKRKTK